MPHIKTLIFLIVYFCLSIQISANEPKHILVLHSYHQSMGWIKKINQSIVDVLKPEENNYILHIENMDTKRIYTPEYIQNLKEIYHTKYQNYKLIFLHHKMSDIQSLCEDVQLYCRYLLMTHLK